MKNYQVACVACGREMRGRKTDPGKRQSGYCVPPHRCNGERVRRYTAGNLVRRLIPFLFLITPVYADITRWDNGQVIPGTEGITPGPGVPLTAKELHFADLRGLDLTGVAFDGSHLAHADLSGSNLTGTRYPGADLTGVNFSGTNLTDASLKGVKNFRLDGATFTGATVSRLNLTDTAGWNFAPEQLYATGSYAAKDLRGMNFTRSTLPGWNFSGQDLTGSVMVEVHFENTDFTGANLTNVDMRHALETGGAVFTDARIDGMTLPWPLSFDQFTSTANYKNKGPWTGVTFTSGFDIEGLDFSGQDLRGIIFEDSAELRNTNFSNTNLTGVNFVRVYIGGSDFTGAIGYVPEGQPRTPGDANLDSMFDSADLVRVFTVGEYEDDTPSNSGWEDGDWNGDGEFSSTDLVIAFQAGAYERPASAVSVVPEPSAALLMLLGLLALKVRR